MSDYLQDMVDKAVAEQVAGPSKAVFETLAPLAQEKPEVLLPELFLQIDEASQGFDLSRMKPTELVPDTYWAGEVVHAVISHGTSDLRKLVEGGHSELVIALLSVIAALKSPVNKDCYTLTARGGLGEDSAKYLAEDVLAEPSFDPDAPAPIAPSDDKVHRFVNAAVVHAQKNHKIRLYATLAAMAKMDETAMISELFNQVDKWSTGADLDHLPRTVLVPEDGFAKRVTQAVLDQDLERLKSVVNGGYSDLVVALITVIAVLKDEAKTVKR